MITHRLLECQLGTRRESSFDHHFLELHGLATRCIHRHTILTLVGFQPDVRLPLALEVSLLGGDSFLTAKQAIAAKVLVAFLHKTEPRFVPDKSIVHEFLERRIDVALAFEKFVPLGHASIFIANHADCSSNPMVHAKGIIALQKPRIAPLVPAEQSSASTASTPCRIFQHGKSFGNREFPAAQRDHAHARGNIVVEHNDGILGEMFQHPVAHGTNPRDFIGDRFNLQPRVMVVFSLAFGDEERRCRKQLVAGDRAAATPRQDH